MISAWHFPVAPPVGARVEILSTMAALDSFSSVAPPVGARVEIRSPLPIRLLSRRRPSRGGASRNTSLRLEEKGTDRRPSRGGASRNVPRALFIAESDVAPPVGARVEMGAAAKASGPRPKVAPPVGARVEILLIHWHFCQNPVAPPVGARVEMEMRERSGSHPQRRPSRGGASRNISRGSSTAIDFGSPLPWGRE